MNNTLKKSLAILLAITMVLSMTTIALAEEQVFPEINSVEKRIYANGVPITIEAGPTTGTSIKYGNNSYLDLDDSDGELFEADLSEYSIYGGSKDESGLNTNITMTGGEVYAIYGSSKDMSVSSTNITMAGGEVTNIYGGGGASSGDICASVENNTAVTVNGGKVWYVYGGGNYSSVSGDAVVTVNGGTVGFLYGGGDKALVSGDAYVTVNAGTVDILYGGGSEGLVSGNTFVSISGGTIGQVYGGGRVGSVGGNTSIEISGTASITQDGDTNGFKGYVYGGSENSESTVKGNVSIKVNGGEVYKILGGGSHGTVIGDVKVEIISGAVDYVYGGGRFSDATVNNTSVLVSGGTVWAVYGGGNEGNVSYDTSVDISGGTIQNIYGGGYGDTTYDTRGIVGGNTFVTVSEGVVNGSIYGGGLIGTVIGDTSVTVSGGTFDIDSYNCGYIYGGGDNGSVSGNTFVLISDGIVRNVYGGGLIGDVSGDTSVIVSGGTMSKIYGGGSDGNVSGNTSVTISAGTIPDNMVFGGGYGTTALTGNKNGYVAIAGKADVDSFTNLINLTNDGWVLIGSPTIPVNQTMTIDDGKTLTINEDAILTNNGTLSLAGTLSGEGTLAGNGVFKKSLHVGDTITVNDMTYTGENLTPIINTETIMGKEFVYDTTGYAKTYNKINDGNWEAVTDVKEIGEYEISITNGSIVFYADFDVIGVVFSNVNTALTIKQSPIYGDNWNDILNIDASKFSAQLNSQDVVGTYTLLVDDTSFDGDSIPNQGIHSYKAVFTSADSVFKDVEVVSGSIEVAKKEVSISWGNQDFIYNGSEQKPTATITNKIGIDDVSIAVTGGMKDVGTNYTATATLTGEKADNYELPTETEVNYNIVAANVTGNVTISNTDANTNKKPDSGDTVTADISAINIQGGTANYQWKKIVDDLISDIGTNQNSYGITVNDTEGKIFCEVSFTGNTTGTITSNELDIAKEILTGIIEITGEKVLGSELIVSEPTNSTIAKSDYDFVWFRDTIEITGENTEKHTISKEDLGKTIKVVITAKETSANYSGSLISNEVSILALAPEKAEVKASAENGNVNLSWSKPFANGSEITGYSLVVEKDKIGITGSPFAIGKDDTTYNVGNLTNRTTYTFVLSTENSIGTTDSEAVTATPRKSSTGSSSSNSSNTVTPTTENLDSVTEVSINMSTIVTNGIANATISDKSITDAIAQAEEDGNSISIELNVDTNTEIVNSVIAELSNNSLDQMVTAGVKEVTIKNEVADICLDFETLKEIQKQLDSDFSISVKKVDQNTLSAEEKKLVGNRPVFDLSITGKDGNKVTDFGNGFVTVSIPYTLGVNENPENLVVYFIDNTGMVKEMPNAVYNGETKTVSFVTDHFSKFAVGYKQDTVTFEDVTNHWAKESIEFMASRGLIAGTGNSNFSPDMSMTRGMFVTVLGRLAEADNMTYTESSFSDVKADSYYMPYIEWANKNGIVKGTGATTFEPDQNINREQMATILLNYTDVIGVNLPKVQNENMFLDNSEISTWAKNAVKEMQMAGVISGKNNNSFDPQGTATRAEASTMLQRLITITIDISTTQDYMVDDSGK